MTPHPRNVGGVASSTKVFEIAADFISPLVVTLALEGKKGSERGNATEVELGSL